MKKFEKIEFARKNNPTEWAEAMKLADSEVSKRYSMFCVCGKMCTGLHESYCRKFKEKVKSEAIRKVSHLFL